MSSTAQHSLAILDDYHSIAPAYFSTLALSPIASYPQTLSPHDPSQLGQLIARLKPYSIISTMRERTAFPRAVLCSLPNLQLLLTTGMHNAALDLGTARAAGVAVAGTTSRGVAADWAGFASFQSTAQHTWSLILALTSRVAIDSPSLQGRPAAPLGAAQAGAGAEAEAEADGRGAWQSGWSVSLVGKTLGLVGLGRLGAQVGRTAVLGFGMEVVAWSENLSQELADERAAELGVPRGSFRAVGKEELFRAADVVSLHYVLSERSRGVVGERELGWMKGGAFLVNTSRGPLVDEEALFRCLSGGRIRGAGLDVFWEEPLGKNSKWRTTGWGRDGKSEVVLSPHMGYVEEKILRMWYEEQAEVVDRFIKNGEVMNKMN